LVTPAEPRVAEAVVLQTAVTAAVSNQAVRDAEQFLRKGINKVNNTLLGCSAAFSKHVQALLDTRVGRGSQPRECR
jgi:transposase-like protein